MKKSELELYKEKIAKSKRIGLTKEEMIELQKFHNFDPELQRRELENKLRNEDPWAR